MRAALVLCVALMAGPAPAAGDDRRALALFQPRTATVEPRPSARGPQRLAFQNWLTGCALAACVGYGMWPAQLERLFGCPEVTEEHASGPAGFNCDWSATWFYLRYGTVVYLRVSPFATSARAVERVQGHVRPGPE